MSALPPQADIGWVQWDVRFVPEADSCTATKKLSLFEARSCVDELGHPSKLPYDWKPTLVMQGPPGAADCGKHRQAAGSRNSNRLSVIVPMMMPAVALEVVVDPACAVTDRRPPERLTKNPADHPAGNCPNRTGNYKS
jgi:hypothetical protein